MYSVKYLFGEKWQIVGKNHCTCFTGNQQQAEEWLDFQDNLARQSIQWRMPPSREILTLLCGIFSAPTRFVANAIATWFYP